MAIVPHDENRCADAVDLRYEFLAEYEDEPGDPDWIRSPCSFLELLIVLSRQLGFEMDDDPKIWFWHLLNELDIGQFNDSEYDGRAEEVVEDVTSRVVWRTYEPDGHGGLFPLQHPSDDQRKIELWYQLNAYLIELF